jgi:hypothetical protein
MVEFKLDYKLLSIDRNPIKERLKRANDITKQFIKDRNLIITGGTAIDLALKLKGDFIYDVNSADTALPDLDFLSPQHLKDAYELADIIFTEGLGTTRNETDGSEDPNGLKIDCIRGLHIQTLRVRLFFEPVADVSYVHPEIYKNIPFLVIDGMRVIHPHWQMMNQHHSIAFPLVDPDREVIFNRLNKDITRNEKYFNAYPIPNISADFDMFSIKWDFKWLLTLDDITDDKVSSTNAKKHKDVRDSMYRDTNDANIGDGSIARKSKDIVDIAEVLDNDMYSNIENSERLIMPVLNGFSAYAAIYNIYKNISVKSKSQILSLDGIHPADINKNGFSAPINVCEFIYGEIPKDDVLVAYYEPFMDHSLPIFEIKSDEPSVKLMLIHHLENTIIPVTLYSLETDKKSFNVYIPHSNIVLLNFLLNYHISESKAIYSKFYISLVTMIKRMSEYVTELLKDPVTANKATTIILNTPFFIPKRLYGRRNESESYDIMRLNSIIDLQRYAKLRVSTLPYTPAMQYKPNKTGEKEHSFDYDKSALFHLSGRRISIKKANKETGEEIKAETVGETINEEQINDNIVAIDTVTQKEISGGNISNNIRDVIYGNWDIRSL